MEKSSSPLTRHLLPSEASAASLSTKNIEEPDKFGYCIIPDKNIEEPEQMGHYIKPNKALINIFPERVRRDKPRDAVIRKESWR